MAGQSANLTVEQARRMTKAIQHTGSHANGNGGKTGGKKGPSTSLNSSASHQK
jgi:hypothetical protein